MTPEQQPAFRFPVCYEEEGQFLLRTGNDVETVVLLSNRNSSEKNHIKVNVDMEEYRRIKAAE